MSEFLERLRIQTEQSEIEQSSQQEERHVLEELAANNRNEIRERIANEFVRSCLDAEISKTDKEAERAALRAQSSVRREWRVRTHATGQNHLRQPAIITKIDEDDVALEVEKVTKLRSALDNHYREQGFTTVLSEILDGFKEEVLDYGTVFNETGRIYGLEISWLPAKFE